MSRTARSPRRAFLPVAAVLAAAIVLTGCAAGQVSQTADQVSAIDGASGTVGHIGVRNALLATPTGTDYPKGADAPLQFWVSNDGITGDTLTSVSTPAASSVVITGTATLPPQTLADFTGSTVKLTLKGLTGPITYGKSVPVTFSFATAGNLTVNVPVEIPQTRTTGRPDINIQPAPEGSLWESGAATPGAGG